MAADIQTKACRPIDEFGEDDNIIVITVIIIIIINNSCWSVRGDSDQRAGSVTSVARFNRQIDTIYHPSSSAATGELCQAKMFDGPCSPVTILRPYFP